MRRKNLTAALFSSLAASLICLTTACSSTKSDSTSSAVGSSSFGDSEASVLAHKDVRKKEPIVFSQPIDEVREAGLRALTYVGCEIKLQKPFYLEGRRPNKFGLFVGSGGETVNIFLLPKENATHVWVDTDLSFVGIAGQQGWHDQTLTEMRRILETPTTGTTTVHAQ